MGNSALRPALEAGLRPSVTREARSSGRIRAHNAVLGAAGCGGVPMPGPHVPRHLQCDRAVNFDPPASR